MIAALILRELDPEGSVAISWVRNFRFRTFVWRLRSFKAMIVALIPRQLGPEGRVSSGEEILAFGPSYGDCVS